MRKGREVIGKPLVSYDTGERFDRIIDLLFDQDSNQVVGFLISESGFLQSARVLLLEKVRAIGPDAVIVDSQSLVDRANKIPLVSRILKRNNVLKGTRIMTMDGRDLGTMVDLYFDEQSGVVDGYEVSGGLFADAYSGRSFVPAPSTLNIGEDVAFVPVHTADLMQEQVGGIKGAVITAGDKVQDTAQMTGDKIGEISQATGDKFQEIGSATAQKAQLAASEANQRLQSAAAVTSQRWQELSEVASDKAQIAAVEANQRLQSAASVTGEKIQELSEAANAKARTASAATNDQIRALSRTTSAALTNQVVSPEEQRAFVIGKTAQQTVVTPTDIPVVSVGEVIRPETALIAQTAGVLDALYRSAGGSVIDKVGERFDSAVASIGIESALGRRVQGTLRADSGMIIAAPGQIVTEAVVERAKTSHKEQALLNSVGLSTDTAIRNQAEQLVGTTGTHLNSGAQSLSDKTQAAGDQLQAGAQSVWEQLKATASNLQELSTHAITENRIKGALGRPVTRVILDRNDGVILNVGDLITHQAIESARQSDVLDALLGSVYVETPKLSLEDLRAPKPGKAAL